ncbi:glycine zipper 2TM domain-containing protein [Sphingomonas bacterium]|uniref:glycine zipper 2TM domain-containing protein n=1 Tax=Sphingomonas bacterium TaxID=1895847 RepID=UPI001575CBC0|nr:glycine zipper 2TM domain-containing protein [Sphingomonas bacterium]
MLSRLVTAGLAIATLATAMPVIAQSPQEDRRFADAQARFDREYQLYRQAVDRYQSSRQAGYPAPAYPGPGYNNGGYAPPPPPPSQGYYDTDRVEQGYEPSRYYRASNQERVLAADDRVYAGNDGRYYCKRNDGTTGLIIGAAGGGLLGNLIAGGHSKTVGTLLGAAGGALAGKAVDQNSSEVRCR